MGREISLHVTIVCRTLTGLDVLSIGIVHHRKPEEKAIGQAVVLDDGQVLFLSHETSQGAEASVADELRVTQLTR